MAYYENSEDASSGGARTHYRYDSRGNRIESVDEVTGRRMQLAYDAVNQLVQVSVQEEGKHFTQRYRYDAFGRRLAKYNDLGNSEESEEAGEESGTDYFGWDGDRLVHTERFNSGNAKNGTGAPQPEVIHTVYEPGSFTPLVQLRRAAKAQPDLVDELLNEAGCNELLFPILHDLTATMKLIRQQTRAMGIDQQTASIAVQQLQKLQYAEQREKIIKNKETEVRYYLCDHLGVPNALLSKEGLTEWAAAVNAWGNIEKEYNRHKLYQPIGLPGQNKDRNTRLIYNRFRYYDCILGRYIQQDPIGLQSGAANLSIYLANPLQFIDPLGLETGMLQDWLSSPGMQAQYHKAITDQEVAGRRARTSVCPPSPPRSNPDWKSYVGNPAVFHCGYEGFLANVPPTRENPMNECFYDEKQMLVDKNHRYAACGGTPDQYPASDWLGHGVFDSGGVTRAGAPAFWESMKHKWDNSGLGTKGK